MLHAPGLRGLHPRVLSAAMQVGVARLADVTGLDRLGVPVWQAVRPWSRALSVSQGKGLTDDHARLGAAMESIECACAENWAPAPLQAAWRDLPLPQRTGSCDDFALRRGVGPAASAVQPWALATRLDGSGVIHVAYDAVSLDLTRCGEPGIERISTGLAAHMTYEAAVLTALFEVIERDAAARWGAGRESLLHAAHRVAVASVQLAWFEALIQTVAEAGATLRLYVLPALIPLPVFVATLTDPATAEGAHSAIYGVGAHNDPEQALLAAVLEAVQSRLTRIAGARDDLVLEPPQPAPGGAQGLAGLMPPLMRPREFATIRPFTLPADGRGAIATIVEALSRIGSNEAAVITLSPPEFPVSVVKVIVPGLASGSRARR